MRTLIGLSFLAAMAFAVPASAQAPDTNEMNARRLYNAGEVAFDAERYDAALSYFEQAYALSSRPELLYNIGVSAERAGQTERALEAFARYIEARPDAPNRLEVEGRVRVLQAERDAHAPPVVAPPPPPDAVALAAPEPTPVTRETSRSSSRAAGIGILSGSAALAIGGAVMLGLGAHDYSTVEDAADGTTWSSIEDAARRAPRLSNAGIVCGIAGLAGAAVGIVLVAKGGADDDASTEVAFTGTGLVVRRSF